MRFFYFYIIRKPDHRHITHFRTPTAADACEIITCICGGNFLF